MSHGRRAVNGRGRSRAVVGIVVAGALALGPPAAAVPKASTGSPGTPAASTPLSTPLLSLRRLPDFVLTTVADQRVHAAIDAAWNQATLGPGAATSCLDVSQGGRTLFADNTGIAVLPASNMKLLTATAALDKLGPDARFTTEVKASGPPIGGVVRGNLYLVGGGDPLLRTPAYVAGLPYPEPTYTSLVQLAALVKAAGVHHVEGNVVGDETRYDRQRNVPSWKPTYAAEGDVGPLSALQVDDGFERVTPPPAATTTTPTTAKPSPLVGAATARTTTAPATTLPGATATTVPATPTTTAPKSTTTPKPAPPAKAGSPDGAPAPSIQVPAPQPAVRAAQVFAGLLAAEGVSVGGDDTNGVTPASAAAITSIQSAPLSAVLGVILRSSDDTGSELLTKELGFRFGGGGTTAAGTAVIKADLAVDGLAVTALNGIDGSGLDRGDRVSCGLLAADLQRAGLQSPLGQGLPVSGRSGTLIHRLSGAATLGRVWAKTGSLDGVSALSGFVTPAAAVGPTPALTGPLVFSLVTNGTGGEAAAEHLVDLVAATLAEFPDVPALASIEPTFSSGGSR